MQTELIPKHDVFTGFEYVLMDIAGQWGLDKLAFPERLSWAYEHIDVLETIGDQRGHWKESPLFHKGVMALRRIQQGQPTGHMIGLDASNSGMQMLSMMVSCKTGATHTGLVDPEVRADAYTDCTTAMKVYIPALQASARQDIKQACMTMLYGSKKVPENLFGEETRELNAFYQAMYDIAPGACRLISILKDAWRPFARDHSWALPDNHHVEVPVMEQIETRIEVDELEHTKFNYVYSINKGSKKGISLIANVTHSVDAYVLRCMIRRCNYDVATALAADLVIQNELLRRELEQTPDPEISNPTCREHSIENLLYRMEQAHMVDVSLMNYLNDHNVVLVPNWQLVSLKSTLEQMLTHAPFPIVCVHDEFKASPDDLNDLRHHYREIMAQLCESNVLNDILTQITGKPYQLPKINKDLPALVRQSNYGIC